MSRGDLRRRRQSKRRENRTVLLATNGVQTEMTYLSWVKRAVNGAGSGVRVTAKFIRGEPATVLKKLSSPEGDTSGYDDVWIIVDEDGQDRSDWVRQVVRKSSRAQQWRAVVTRPCFEAWLVAHYVQVRNYANQGEAQRHYRELVGKELPAKELPSDFPYDHAQQAVGRCQLAGTRAQPGSDEVLPPYPGSAMPQLLHALGVIDLPSRGESRTSARA